MRYSEVLKQHSDLRQYLIYFPGDYSTEIAYDVGTLMSLKIDKTQIESILYNRRRNRGEESIYFVEDAADIRIFILLDCNPGDWIHSIIVRCKIEDSKNVNRVLLYWLNRCLTEEKQNKQVDILEDNMFDEHNDLHETIKRHKLDMIYN